MKCPYHPPMTVFSGGLVSLLLAVSLLAGTQASAGGRSILGGPFAVLEHGSKGGYEWRVYISPLKSSQRHGLPCMDVSVERDLRPVSEAEVFTSCGAVKPFPLVTQVVVGSGEGKVMVAGMAFDRAVRMVKIRLSDGRAVWRRARVISRRGARKAHVDRFAFLAFPLARGLSIGRVIGYDAAGRPISGLIPQ
jgi:hypothetical protein